MCGFDETLLWNVLLCAIFATLFYVCICFICQTNTFHTADQVTCEAFHHPCMQLNGMRFNDIV